MGLFNDILAEAGLCKSGLADIGREDAMFNELSGPINCEYDVSLEINEIIIYTCY